MPSLPGRYRRAVAAMTTSLIAGALVVAAPMAAHADADPASITITSSSSSATPSFTVTGSFDYSGYDAGSSNYLGAGGLSSAAVIQVGVDATTVCEFDMSSSVWVTKAFSCQIGPLAVGQYTVWAALRDDKAGGSQAYARTSQDFIYDVTPVTTTPPVAVAPTVTITSGNTASSATPTITGTYDSGTYDFPGGGSARGPLNIYKGDTLICQVYSSMLTAASGTYSCTLWTPLSSGVSTIQARLMDATKTEPVAVANQTLSYIPAPTGPVLPPVTPPVTPTPAVAITSPATATSTSPTLSGTVTAGSWASGPRSVFEVYVGADLVCTSSLSSPTLAGGTWTCALDVLSPGAYDVFVRILADVTNSSVNYATAAQNLVIPSLADPTVPSVTITSPSTATANPPTFSGTFATGEEPVDDFTIQVLVDGVPVCDESSDHLDIEAMTWSCTSDTPLESGEHTVSAELLFNGTSYPDLWPTSVASQSLTMPVTGTVTGHVFDDANGNGTQEPGEPDISGVRVELWRMTEGGAFEYFASTVTHSPYVFRFVPVGTYQVRIPAGTSPAGFAGLRTAAVWTVAVSGSGTFTAPAGSFGFTRLTSELAYTGADSAGLIRLASGFAILGLVLAALAQIMRRRDWHARAALGSKVS